MNPLRPDLPLDDPPCNTIMYRAIRRKEWFDPDADRVMAEAFMRRRPYARQDGTPDPGDDDGLSAFDASRIDLQACIEDHRRCFGVATLHLGTLRDQGLTVIRDPADDRKLLITDMPLENPGSAEDEALLDAVAKCGAYR